MKTSALVYNKGCTCNKSQCLVFAYGATGAGKTFTMLGSRTSPGITYLTILELYRQMEMLTSEREFDLAVSHLEVSRYLLACHLRLLGSIWLSSKEIGFPQTECHVEAFYFLILCLKLQELRYVSSAEGKICRFILWLLIPCVSWWGFLFKQTGNSTSQISPSLDISTLYVSCHNQSRNYFILMTVLCEKCKLWIYWVVVFSAHLSEVYISFSTVFFLACCSCFISYIVINTKYRVICIACLGHRGP